MAAVSTINQIALKYEKEMKVAQKYNTRVVRERLDEIIIAIERINKLSSLSINKALVCQRLKRRTPIPITKKMVSTLACIKSKTIRVIIQMSRIRQSLIPTQSMRLINNIIDGTPIQKDLTTWKSTCGTRY